MHTLVTNMSIFFHQHDIRKCSYTCVEMCRQSIDTHAQLDCIDGSLRKTLLIQLTHHRDMHTIHTRTHTHTHMHACTH
jgi:hypothetical protein